ncbi:DAR GTPase 3, chloroplastic isoform X2 [Jatropha curcas]|uniref:DAR GTPase 3, chloroplastic isoform X2 n=1 Tax=Jatropha curcas TaxID=180498 RepID=UPI0009D6EC7F|nr:DAR GTPase 3, chloroplastic isoform X2 [Jatropha curcas]
MGVQILGLWSRTPSLWVHLPETRSKPVHLLPTTALPTTASLSSSPPTIQVVGGKNPTWYGNGNANSNTTLDGFADETDWIDLDSELCYWTKSLRPVQWYPGHIAKTEKELKEQLKLMDVVIEVRDARIPLSTTHPQGTMKLSRLAKALAASVNVKRRAKGLLPRPVRAGIVGYPNVGKSSLINRLLKRRMCEAASRPGVTRELKWVQFGKELELLDSPGMLPMRISDQSAAIKLAICDDIGERSYDVVDVAAILVQILTRIPSVGVKALQNRYKIDVDGHNGRIFVQKLAVHLFNGDTHQAAFRILTDFRKGKFGWVALERPPR